LIKGFLRFLGKPLEFGHLGRDDRGYSMSRLAQWGIGLILLQPLGVWALGLGEIELDSALNQPLSAEIRLISASVEEVDTLKVGLASRDTFERYGLDRPAYLSDVTFAVGKDSTGRNVIKVESVQSMTEPFVTMLVEATWPRGRLLKEYTVLLDPPVLLPQPQAPANVQAPSSASEPASQAGGRIQRPANRSPSAAAPQPTPRPVSRNLSTGSSGTYGPVQRNETLWRIAEQVRPDASLTMNQMMVALYQANPAAFDGNINRLRRGAVLQVPSGAEISGLSTRNATSEVRRQNQDWRGAAAQPGLRLVAPDNTGGASSGRSASSAGADDGALQDEVRGLRDAVAERDRLLEVKDQQLQDLQEQLAAMQGDPGADQAPMDAPGDAMPDESATEDPSVADLDSALDSDELFADEPADAAVEDVGDEAAEPVATPTPSVTSVVTTPAESKGLLGTIIEWVSKPMVFIGGGLLLLLILGLVFLRGRQESAEDITGRWEALEAEEDSGEVARDATARMRAQSEPESFLVEEAESGELTSPGIDPITAETALEDTPALGGDETLSSQTAINLDQADPVAEADFHMAYGLYDQAADLLEKAVNDEPERRDLKLKLLEVFFVWDNKDGFRQSAQALRDEIGGAADGDWDKVAIMGKQICPDDALFSEQVAGAAVDLDLDADGDAPLDFSLDDSAADAVDLDLGAAFEDTGQPTATVALDTLDMGAQTAAGLEAALVGEDDIGSLTSPDLEGLAETMESPTLESPSMDSPTAESPLLDDATVEMPDASPTMESPTVEIEADVPTMETPTLETPMAELPTIEQPALVGGDQTAEINLDDLGLDLDGLRDLDMDVTGQEAALASDPEDTQNPKGLGDIDDNLLSATGVTQVLAGDIMAHANTEALSGDDATLMAPAVDEGTFAGTELLPQASDLDGTNRVEVLVADDTPDPAATAEFRGIAEDDAGLDLNLDDLSAALDGGETVEQPGGAFGDLDLDLDIGSSLNAADDPTATEQVGVIDPQTLTEVGTKLDLARAYIDMGDPEGARSILEEVQKEGDPAQRQEAEGLIGSLSA
jgi:pilus assembly protein FimV